MTLNLAFMGDTVAYVHIYVDGSRLGAVIAINENISVGYC